MLQKETRRILGEENTYMVLRPNVSTNEHSLFTKKSFYIFPDKVAYLYFTMYLSYNLMYIMIYHN